MPRPVVTPAAGAAGGGSRASQRRGSGASGTTGRRSVRRQPDDRAGRQLGHALDRGGRPPAGPAGAPGREPRQRRRPGRRGRSRRRGRSLAGRGRSPRAGAPGPAGVPPPARSRSCLAAAPTPTDTTATAAKATARARHAARALAGLPWAGVASSNTAATARAELTTRTRKAATGGSPARGAISATGASTNAAAAPRRRPGQPRLPARARRTNVTDRRPSRPTLIFMRAARARSAPITAPDIPGRPVPSAEPSHDHPGEEEREEAAGVRGLVPHREQRLEHQELAADGEGRVPGEPVGRPCADGGDAEPESHDDAPGRRRG